MQSNECLSRRSRHAVSMQSEASSLPNASTHVPGPGVVDGLRPRSRCSPTLRCSLPCCRAPQTSHMKPHVLAHTAVPAAVRRSPQSTIQSIAGCIQPCAVRCIVLDHSPRTCCPQTPNISAERTLDAVQRLVTAMRRAARRHRCRVPTPRCWPQPQRVLPGPESSMDCDHAVDAVRHPAARRRRQLPGRT